MVSQSCGIVRKRYVVEDQQCYQRIGRWRYPMGCNSKHVSICSGLAAIFSGIFQL